MPICPRCDDEYEPGVATCAACGVPLLADEQADAPRVDRLLGTFHPEVVERVTELLEWRGIAHEVVALSDDRVEVVVDRAWRDDVRAELAVNWSEVVGALDIEVRVAVVEAGGTQPGWYDAPTTAWVDRAGRLQVDAGDDEEALAEAGRLWGPSLVAIGAVVGLFGWYAQDSAALLVLGGATVLVGLFLPH